MGLLSDVLALRITISNALDPATSEALRQRDEVYIAVVAAGGYEVDSVDNVKDLKDLVDSAEKVAHQELSAIYSHIKDAVSV